MDYNNSTAGNISDSIDVITSFLPYWAVVLYFVMFWLIDIIGIIGNCMIIIAVAVSQKLQTSTNVFVTSLAVTDLLTCFAPSLGFFVPFFPLTPRLNQICQFVAFVAYSSIGTSLYTLGAIGINRLIFITNPNLGKRIFTPWKLVIYVAILWIVPSGSFLIALANGVGAIGFDPVYKECGKVNTHEAAKVLDLLMFAVGFPLPCAAIIVSYTWIYIHIKKHFKTQKHHLINLRATSPVSSGSSSSLSRPQESAASEAEITVTTPRLNRISRQQIQITKNLFLVVCAFFICFIPMALILLVGKPSPTVNDVTWYLELLAFVNFAINIFIYASKHPDFKIVLGHMMRCSYSKIPQPSRLLKFLLSKIQ